jgi:hypothetical protein
MSSFSRPAESAPTADDQPAPALTSATTTAKPFGIEWLFIAVALVALVVLRIHTLRSHQWNTDEPQHLHVVWGWTVGKLQYKDVFDNHTPLFHILSAPLLQWVGERPDIILIMRRAMIPLFALSLWFIYRLAVVTYDRRTAWFAVLLAGYLPAFFFRMGEYRTDVLWTTVWLASLAVGLSGALQPRRTFAAALLLGAAFSVSMKSTLLLLCLGVAGGITWWLAGRPVSRQLGQHIAAFIVGLLLIPSVIVGYFASRDALPALYHCVIAHNTMPGQNLGATITKNLLSQHMLWLIPVALLTRAMLPSVRRDPARGWRRLFLFLIAGTFYSLLRGFWPVVTTQDFMPWMPLLPIFVVAGLAWAQQWLCARTGVALPWVLAPALVLLGEAAWVVKAEPFGKNEDKRVSQYATLFRLTDPGEYVLDLKGETIFRPRPTYLVLESLTRAQIQNGTLKDDTIERLIATRTAVVNYSDRLMPKTKEFVERNYVHVQNARVLGQKLQTVRDQPLKFQIAIPERYVFIGSKGAVQGTIDGQPIDGPHWLDAGTHDVTITNHSGDTAVVWARAWERGYSPFVTFDPNNPK